MSDQTLYRKYRPKQFADVIGQDHIVSVLEGSLKKGDIGHAYLFVGSRGTGKTSVARIFARELGSTVDDIYELDAASNNGVDDIRLLNESVQTLPFTSKYKVYILDEVHMLSKAAANAFLKTLEEPPKHVIFILATTDPEKLPETIVSRCQTFTFKKPTETVLTKMVHDVAKQEGITLDPDGAATIALAGDGSFRDTLGLLQKVLSHSGDKKISTEEIERVTGAPRATAINEYILALILRDIEKGMKAVDTAKESNVDMKLFLKLVMHKFRLALIARYAPALHKANEADFSESDRMFIQGIIKEKEGMLSSKTLVSMLHAYEDLGNAYLPELPLEILLLNTTVSEK